MTHNCYFNLVLQENITSTMIYYMFWLMLPLPLTNSIAFEQMATFMRYKTIWQQNLYCDYSTSVEDIVSCVVLAIDKDHDKFVFDSVTGPGKCALCSHCPELGTDAQESHNYGWSELYLSISILLSIMSEICSFVTKYWLLLHFS